MCGKVLDTAERCPFSIQPVQKHSGVIIIMVNQNELKAWKFHKHFID